jgi:hypothetical protein
MKREEAMALVKEIFANQVLPIYWVSLVFRKPDRCEIHIRLEKGAPDFLQQFVAKHNLALKEVNGVLIIRREHQRPH